MPDRKPDVCPNCGKIEDKKVTCRHCDYEYEDDPPRWWEVVLLILVMLIALWILMTLIAWFVNGNKTLVEILSDQWEWFVKLIHRIK